MRSNGADDISYVSINAIQFETARDPLDLVANYSLQDRVGNFNLFKNFVMEDAVRTITSQPLISSGISYTRRTIQAIPDSKKETAALLCTLISGVAIPVLVYVALLCTVGSRLIEIPQDSKPKAALGAWLASAMYGATFIFCYNYKSRSQEHTLIDERQPLNRD